MAQTIQISDNLFREQLPSRYVKPIQALLISENAPEEVRAYSKSTIKWVVLNEVVDSPIWPYVLLLAEKTKAARKQSQIRKNKLIK